MLNFLCTVKLLKAQVSETGRLTDDDDGAAGWEVGVVRQLSGSRGPEAVSQQLLHSLIPLPRFPYTHGTHSPQHTCTHENKIQNKQRQTTQV